MSLTWDEFDEWVSDGDMPVASGALLRASEAELLAFTADSVTRIRSGIGDLGRWFHHPAGGYALAVIACSASAAEAAGLLCLPGMRAWHEIPVGSFLEIARAREVTWLGELGVRLATAIPAEGVRPGAWRFVATLLDEGAAEPPATHGAVRSWLMAALQGPPDEFAATPHLDRLLPAAFDIDGLGVDLAERWIVDGVWDERPRFPGAVARLAAEGRVDRAKVLALTVDRLVRGDQVAALGPFIALHAELSASPAELAAHTVDYVRLLIDAPSSVAALAQRSLRAVDDARLLDPETLLEASPPVLVRPEKALVKAQVTWLDKVARRAPERAGEIVETIAVALDHPVLDVHEHALAVVGRHLPHVPPGSFVHDRVAVLTGEVPDPLPEAVLPPAPRAAPMPTPIRSAAELAEEVTALLHEQTGIRWERVLAGLVTLAPSGLAGTLGPVLDRHAASFGDGWGRLPLLGAAIRAALGHDLGSAARERLHAATHGDLPSLIDTPEAVLTLRIAEVAMGLAERPLPLLLATPTHVTGSLDAEELAGRLARVEAAGGTPWPLDLQQALLRVPRATESPALEQAAALTSPAGRQLAAWLRAGGLPDPVSTRFEQCTRAPDGSPVARRAVTNLEPARTDDGRILLEDVLVTLSRRPTPDYRDDGARHHDTLPMVLPHHREAAAAWALPSLAALADQDGRDASLLPLLADCSGPAGPAMVLAVAYGLGARHQGDRVAAVDAFLSLAAETHTADGFAVGLGVELGDLCSDGTVKLRRVVHALTDAFQAGAAAAVGEVLRAALPALLRTLPPGLPGLLELCSRSVTSTGTRGEVPGLAVLAARGGGSTVVREAKRLHGILSAP